LFYGCEGAEVLLSLGDFRAPGLSLRMARVGAGLDEELELFMRLLMIPELTGIVPESNSALKRYSISR